MYTLWMQGMEGWHPTECESLEQCFKEMLAVAHVGDFRITKEVRYSIIETPFKPGGILPNISPGFPGGPITGPTNVGQ